MGDLNFKLLSPSLPPAKDNQQGSLRFYFELPLTNFFSQKRITVNSVGVTFSTSAELGLRLDLLTKTTYIAKLLCHCFFHCIKKSWWTFLSWFCWAFSDGSFFWQNLSNFSIFLLTISMFKIKKVGTKDGG